MIAKNKVDASFKSRIYHHRSYRKLPKSKPGETILDFLICAILIDVIILITYPSITYAISYVGKMIFSNIYTQYQIINRPFILGDVYLLDIFGKYPNQTFSIYAALISLLIIVVIPLAAFFTKPVAIWLILVSFINLISSVFFIFFANYFPYSMVIYLDLYMKTMICVWLIIPYILLLGFIPLPTNFVQKLKVISFSMIYSIIFGCLRYLVYIFILREFSYLFMAIIFFMFGPFFDFIYIVSFYSVFVSNLAVKISGDDTKWGWLY